MRRISGYLIALCLLMSPEIAWSATWVQCGTTNTSHASCGDETAGSTCTYTDSQGVEHTGSVRSCPPCTHPDGRPVGLSGTYCFSKNSAAPAKELCPGGEVIIRQGEAIGCLFKVKGLNASKQESCNGLAILKPARIVGTCTVCVPEELKSSVQDQAAWEQFQISGKNGNADFSCLQGRRIQVTEQPLPITGPVQPSHFCNGTWTPWLNRDNPGGSGDYETLRDHVKAGKVCESPKLVECRTRKDGVPWNKVAEKVHCDVKSGGYCVNKEQAPGVTCSDFEVRFCC